MPNLILQISPTETLTAVVDKGKLAYIKTEAVEGSYVFRNGRMREQIKPAVKTKLIQAFIPAELFRTQPDKVMAFFEAHKDLCGTLSEVAHG